MALVRILVDGYSLLHNWTELAPGKPRYSAAAREDLIAVLTQYHDACGTPITVVFDGSRSKRERNSETASTPGVEILYSTAGETADQLIERAAYRFKDYGEVLAVTDDYAERDTVINFGGLASSCDSFIRTLEGAVGEMQRDIQRHNFKEGTRYRTRCK